jgi:hypothetical protein
LERVLGAPASFWLNLEKGYRELLARKAEQARLEDQAASLKDFPYGELVKRGVFEKEANKTARVGQILSWLQVANVDALHDQICKGVLAYRRSPKYDLSALKLAAWMRLGELEFDALDLPKYDAEGLKKNLQKLKSLTLAEPATALARMKELTTKCGLAALVIPGFSSFPVSGITRWRQGHPLIQLTLRGRRADKFWFTLFHEIGHVLRHSQTDIFIEIMDRPHQDNPYETQANQFAEDVLIPPDDYEQFTRRLPISREQIIGFAKKIGVAPGIVLGRLQNDNVVQQSHFVDLHLRTG